MVFPEPTFHKATVALNPSTAFQGPQIKSRLHHTPPLQALTASPTPLYTISPHPNYSHGNPSVLQRNQAFSCLRAFARDAYVVLHTVTILSSLQVTAEMLLPQGGPHRGEIPSLLLISNSHQAVLFYASSHMMITDSLADLFTVLYGAGPAPHIHCVAQH